MSDFHSAEKSFFDSYVDLDPVLGSDFGIHELDWRLPDGGPESHAEEVRLLKGYLRTLDEIGDDGLDAQLARYFASLTLFEAEKVRTWSRMPMAPDKLGSAIFLLLVRHSHPLPERLDAIATRLEAAPGYLSRTSAALTEPEDLWCRIALEQSEELPALFEAATAVAHGQPGADRVRRAAAEATTAVTDFARWLRTEVLPRARNQPALGEARFTELLGLRLLPGSADEIMEVGRRYLAEADAERAELISTHWPGRSVQEVQAIVGERHAADFQSALSDYRQSMAAARSFITDHELATVPERETLEVIETPSFLVPTLPFAAYFPAAYFDRDQVGIYVVTPPQVGESMAEHSLASIQNTSVHEAYPGHHLQFVCANRHPSLTRLLCSQQATEFIEGWAHYCEQLMYEQGFSHSPEVRFIQLNDMLWRGCRIVIDVELSRGRMQPQEAVKMLVDVAAMQQRQAVAEVNRYTYTPGYQLSYLYGKHLLTGLRDRVRAEQGSAFSLREFHDRLLYAGSTPAALWDRLFEEPVGASAPRAR